LVGFFPLKESLEKYFNVICLLNSSSFIHLVNEIFIAGKTLLTVPYVLMECHGGFVYEAFMTDLLASCLFHYS